MAGRDCDGGGVDRSLGQRIGRRSRVDLWAPPKARGPLPLVVVFDGEVHVDALGTPGVFARAVAAGAMPPVAAAFVDSGPRRGDVLGIPDGRARWVADTLVPRLHTEGIEGHSIDASRTVVTGSSFGGLSALFALARAPGRISAALAQSTSLWRYPDGAFVEPLAAADEARRAHRGSGVRLRLHSGTYEGSLPSRANELVASLEDRGLDAAASTVSGGHDWAWWVPDLVESLAELLGRAADRGKGGAPPAPQDR